MKIEIEVPDYSPEKGLHFLWEEDFKIEARIEEGRAVVIKADRGGLVSLARHLLTLASVPVPIGSHFHLDDLNSLEEGSCELIFERGETRQENN